MRLATSATDKTPTANTDIVQITTNLFVLNVAQTMLHTMFSLHLAWRGCVLNN